MRNFLVACVFMAAVTAASSASAAFVLIDNFKPSGSEIGTRSTSGGSFTFDSPGVMSVTLLPGANGQLRYSGILANALSPQTPGDISSGLRLSNFQLTSGTLSNFGATAQFSTNGGTTFSSPSTNFSLDGNALVFNFASDLAAATNLRITFTNTDFDNALSFSANNLFAVPEPTTISLVGLACVGGGIAAVRRRKKLSVA